MNALPRQRIAEYFRLTLVTPQRRTCAQMFQFWDASPTGCAPPSQSGCGGYYAVVLLQILKGQGLDGVYGGSGSMLSPV
jgi:hypothetical protein